MGKGGQIPKVHCHERALYFKSFLFCFFFAILTNNVQYGFGGGWVGGVPSVSAGVSFLLSRKTGFHGVGVFSEAGRGMFLCPCFKSIHNE